MSSGTPKQLIHPERRTVVHELGGCFLHGDSFWPVCAFCHHEKVLGAFGHWKRADNEDGHVKRANSTWSWGGYFFNFFWFRGGPGFGDWQWGATALVSVGVEASSMSYMVCITLREALLASNNLSISSIRLVPCPQH